MGGVLWEALATQESAAELIPSLFVDLPLLPVLKSSLDSMVLPWQAGFSELSTVLLGRGGPGRRLVGVLQFAAPAGVEVPVIVRAWGAKWRGEWVWLFPFKNPAYAYSLQPLWRMSFEIDVYPSAPDV